MNKLKPEVLPPVDPEYYVGMLIGLANLSDLLRQLHPLSDTDDHALVDTLMAHKVKFELRDNPVGAHVISLVIERWRDEGFFDRYVNDAVRGLA